MALLATALGFGAAAAAGGIGATIKANKTNTKPRTVTYGGTQEKQDALEQMNLAGIQQGSAQTTMGMRDLSDSGTEATRLGGKGRSIMQSADAIQQVATPNQGAAILGQYRPGAVAQAQAKQALDANTAASFGAARSGGALGLRNALNANAMTGAQTAQALAVQRAQEEQAYTQAQVAQANQQQKDIFQADQQAQAQKAQLLGIGSQLSTQANALRTNAANAFTQGGLENQNQWLGQEQNLNDQQANLNLEYEKARRAAAEAKASRWANLGSTLVGGGLGIAGGALKGK